MKKQKQVTLIESTDDYIAVGMIVWLSKHYRIDVKVLATAIGFLRKRDKAESKRSPSK
jgi:hypothetical protein